MINDAERHLAKSDKHLALLIRQHGPCTLIAGKRDPFHVLCCSIIGQQLSIKAADTIQARVATQTGAGKKFVPSHFLETEHEDLRGCGLSNAKARWLRAIAEQVESGTFSFKRLIRMSDDAAVAALDALPGVGPWTAEMFLIFALHRLDVFSMGDVGLRRSMDRLYNKGKKLSDTKTLTITRQWAPYRSVASWYLWRMTDGDTQTWT
jgi:DNA-3-methyladenine glycosylase II